jgi:hypothetical protein
MLPTIIFNRIDLFSVFLNLVGFAGSFILILDLLAVCLLLLEAKGLLELELRLLK